MVNIENHPCYNQSAAHHTGRVHLPVARKCNVQCNFCNRKYDCANENRPGVSTAVLSPVQAGSYLDRILAIEPNISVVGIAGPGDPFANPEETLETLSLVHASHPDKLLCLSSNGLYLPDYVDRIAQLGVSHVTITVNAVDASIGAHIYEWFYYEGNLHQGEEGASFLLQRQTEALKQLKRHGIIVKINTVVIPRINMQHVPQIAEYVAALGADVQNCIPLIPVAGTPFETLYEPSADDMRKVRAQASVYINQMAHCARCRADAVGLLGKDNSDDVNMALRNAQRKPIFEQKPYIAVASSDAVSVDLHLGEAEQLLVFEWADGKVRLKEKRSLKRITGDRWADLASEIADCAALLTNGLGMAPFNYLSEHGFFVEAVSGRIDVAATALFQGQPIPSELLRLAGACDDACPASAHRQCN